VDAFSQWFLQLPAASQAALTGAIVGGLAGAVGTLVSGVLRDFIAKWWVDSKECNKSADEIYRRYAEPLAAAATSLMWRLEEMFGQDGRSTFLISKEPRTQFEDYKLRSTYYRLAVLLGWLRALRRELSFLRLAGKHRIEIIEEAIENLEKSLADGHHVELQRLNGLVKIWQLPSVLDEKLSLRIAVDLENCVKKALQNAPVSSALDLPFESQYALCEESAKLICQAAGYQLIPADSLTEHLERAVKQIAIGEAWLYRDWQTSVGDFVLRESTAGGRHFDVIGFGEFETILLSPTDPQFRVLSRIGALFFGVNLKAQDSLDARPAMLRGLLFSTAGLVHAIARIPVSSPLLGSVTVQAAERILREAKQ
jgi:hypothetical protein